MTICALCGGEPSAKVTASWTFRIDRDAPTQNTMGNNKGGGRWAYRKERLHWMGALSKWAVELRVPYADKKRRVRITRCYSGLQKLRDHGNLVGGLKPAIDAMVLCRLLKDDSPHWAEIYYQQRRVEKGERGTLITIEEVE